ncbi:MAG: AmmeMemoRadiSam system protein B [Mariprofundaceae bacterium]
MKVRPAAVAGSFYPDDADALARNIDEMFFEVDESAHPMSPKALIAPHAGYIYSGPTAACAYALLDPDKIKRVILLGPTHRVLISGLAMPNVHAFKTPLGSIPLDTDAMRSVDAMSQICRDDDSHALEHSLEVHLPFLQRRLGNFKLIPFTVGQTRAEMVAEVLNRLWGGDETVIIISSDLSHFHSYETAKQLDAETTRSILSMEPTITHDQACGATPINGLLSCIKKHPLTPKLIDCRNSGDTAGPRDRVVGYGAFAFYENMHEQTNP